METYYIKLDNPKQQALLADFAMKSNIRTLKIDETKLEDLGLIAMMEEVDINDTVDKEKFSLSL